MQIYTKYVDRIERLKSDPTLRSSLVRESANDFDTTSTTNFENEFAEPPARPKVQLMSAEPKSPPGAPKRQMLKKLMPSAYDG